MAFARRASPAIAVVTLIAAVTVARAQTDPPAQYPVEVHLYADAREPGVITLSFYGARGTPVVFHERIGDRRERLGRKTVAFGLATVLRHAVAWRCDRQVRRFVASTIQPDGHEATARYSVRTPTCRTRLELDAPRRLARGETGRIHVRDRWDNGEVSARLCLSAPGDGFACSRLTMARAVAVATRRLRPQRPGRWRVELRWRGRTVRRTIAVGGGAAPRPPLTVLATGDSTMQGIDSHLADELGDAARVRSDLHPGTGLVKPGGPWEKLAAFHVRAVRQDVTVISIGAADDFRLRASDGTVHECCGEAWIGEYSGRVRRQMRTYRRRGAARVVWLTLPIPRGERPFVAASVNAAVIRASAGLRGIAVARMDIVFTPDGHREVMSHRGRAVRIFRQDGVHLTIAGTAIAARLVAAMVRRR